MTNGRPDQLTVTRVQIPVDLATTCWGKSNPDAGKWNDRHKYHDPQTTRLANSSGTWQHGTAQSPYEYDPNGNITRLKTVY
jgi:hypothetical protein